MNRQAVVEIGHTFDRWTVIDGPQRRGIYCAKLWLCQCVCGCTDWVWQSCLTGKKSTGCRSCDIWAYSQACAHLSVAELRYLSCKVSSVFSRCCNPGSKNWVNYGGRGIRIHEEWIADRVKFFVYLASLPGCFDENLSLDRIDNERHYEPGNLRFTNRSVQMNNRRVSHRS